MNCCVPNGLDEVFDTRQAERDLKNYLKRGLEQPARRVAEVVTARGVEGASVLEIGAGAGGLHLELLKAGASQAVDLDLLPAYLKIAETNARRLGYEARVEHRQQNIADEPEAAPEADIVVMNRVICCYPHMEKLVRPAAERARRLLALTFPRDPWWMKTGARLANAMLRLFGSKFQMYLHSTAAVFEQAAASGLRPIHHSFSGLWQIAVFERPAYSSAVTTRLSK